MNQPIHDIKYTGSLRTKASGSSGPADEFSSRSVIDPHGVITQTSNFGTPVSKILGDGRTWTPILGSIPSTPVAGTYYIRNIAGIDTFVFVDSSNVEHPLSSTGMSPGAPVVVPLSNIYPTPNILVTQLVDSTDVIEASIAIVNNTLGTRSFHRVLVSHNGTASSDATVGQVSSSGGIAFGNQQVTFDVIFTGSGVTQNIQLVAYTNLTGLTAYITRPFIVTGTSGGLTPALSAISALSPAADTFPYYTGPTTASLATITSYGRSLVASVDNNAFLGTVGLAGLATTAITGTLTLTKTGVTARTATFPDAAITVAGSAVALTSGRIPYIDTGGLLNSTASFAFNLANQLLSIGDGATAAQSEISIYRTAGQTGIFSFRTGSLNRWRWLLTGTESGSDTGGALSLIAHNDAGGSIDTPISIVRAANGLITLARPVTITPGSGTVTISQNSAVIGLQLRQSSAGVNSPALEFYSGGGYRHQIREVDGAAGYLSFISVDGTTYQFDNNVNVTRAINGSVTSRVTNTTVGTAAQANFQAYNDAGTLCSSIVALSTGYTTAGVLTAGSGGVFSASSAGLFICASNASGTLRLAAGGTTEGMRLTSSLASLSVRTTITGAASTSTPLLSIIPNSGATTDYALAVWGDAPEGTSRRFSVSRGGNAYIDTDLVIGADPGGAHKLRVGGSAIINGTGTFAGTISAVGSVISYNVGQTSESSISSNGATRAGLWNSYFATNPIAEITVTASGGPRSILRYDWASDTTTLERKIIASGGINSAGNLTNIGTLAGIASLYLTGIATDQPAIRFAGATAYDLVLYRPANATDYVFSRSNGATETKLVTFKESGSVLIGTTTDGMTASGSLKVAKDLVSLGQRVIGLRSVTSAGGTTTLDGTDHAVVITGTANQTITMPAAATGRIIVIKSRTTGTVTIQRAGSDTMDGSASNQVLATNQSLMFVANSTDWTII
jgi:hypothetical protein